MLSKINRIKKKKDFDNVFKFGKGFKGRLFLIKTTNNDLKISRFGFIVSSKISKKAVDRNRIRRMASESIRRNFEKIKKGLDVIFIAMPDAKMADYKNIEKDITDLLFKAKKTL